MLPLRIGQRACLVEVIVEIDVQVMCLVAKDGAQWPQMRRKAPVPIVNVLTVGDRSRDCLIRATRNAGLHRCAAPPSRSVPVPALYL
jgi:hypothetical protein